MNITPSAVSADSGSRTVSSSMPPGRSRRGWPGPSVPQPSPAPPPPSTPEPPPLAGIPNASGELPWLFGEGESRSDTPAPEEDALKLLEFLPVAGHDIMVARRREGTLTRTPHETTTLFDTLRARHDYVVVHAPPVSRSFIGVENARLADATILAVRAEKTRKPVVLGLKEQIQEAGGWIVGVVLTHRKSYIPAFIYRFL